MTNDVSVKPSYSDQWFVAKPIAVKTHSQEINTQSGKKFILSRSFSLRPAPPLPPILPLRPALPLPPILPLAPAPPALGAATPVPRQRWEPPPLGSADSTRSLRLPPAPSEAPSKPRRPLRPLPAPPPASLVGCSQPRCSLPTLPCCPSVGPCVRSSS
jgi:hypothetical protein